jgi:CheY-like chemotaxis protein
LGQCPAHAVIINTANPARDLEKLSTKVKDTPTFACSFPSEPCSFLEAGAANYLTKPVTLERLSKALDALQSPLKHILIVDDNPDVQQVLTRLLSLYKPGLEVMAASSAQEALERLRQSSFDLILLDLTLPDKSGWQILQEKNQHPSLKDIPAIIVSAQDLAQHTVTSKTLVTTTASGFSSESILRCSLELSRFLRHNSRNALESL